MHIFIFIYIILNANMRFPDQDNHYYLQFPFLVPQFFPLLRWYNETLASREEPWKVEAESLCAYYPLQSREERKPISLMSMYSLWEKKGKVPEFVPFKI